MRGQINLFAPLRAVFCFGLVLSAFAFAASPTWAQFYVRSPEVSKGELEIEEHGALYSGPGEDERLTQTHELEGKYGITQRFEVILEGVFEHREARILRLRKSSSAANMKLSSARMMVLGSPSALSTSFRYSAGPTRSWSARLPK